MLKPRLDKIFGPGSTEDLWRYLASTEGHLLWIEMLDQGAIYMRDFRGPRAFDILGLTGDRSWLGIE